MRTRPAHTVALLAALLLASWSAAPAHAASKREIDAKATAALNSLVADKPGAKELLAKCKAVLIFPEIVKGGFMVGGQVGAGVLRKGGKSVSYHRSWAASYGLQAGAQTFGYVLMFMDDASLAYLNKTDGWEIGVGPSIVVVDEGMGKSLTSTTLHKGVYAFIFDQKGLMAGMGIQGSKITKINPGR
jgi:lipid-binding SYLF domain-containing protein